MWLVYSVGAALFWGVLYLIREQLYKHISIYTSIAISTGLVAFFAAIISVSLGHARKDLHTIVSSKEALLYLCAGVAILLGGEILIASSITAKNATLAGLIEISYPVFIALFGYLFFKKVLPWETLIGAALVFAGIFVIYHFNK